MGKIVKKSALKEKIKKPKVKLAMKAKPHIVTKPKVKKNLKQMKKRKEEVQDSEDYSEPEDTIEPMESDEETNGFDETDNIADNSDDQIESEEEGADSDSEASNSGDDAVDHQAALKRLKDTDPEFYKFLQDNDKKLLNFNVSDSEQDSDDEQEESHKPGELEVASDESDFEDDSQDLEQASQKHITLKMVKSWQQELQLTQKSNQTIVEICKAFNAALRSVSPDAENNGAYIVKGSGVFNAVVQVCVLYLGPAVRGFLQLKKGQQAHKSKRFTKIKSAMKQYFTDLDNLLSNVTSGNILNILLKHLHYMSSILASFPNCGKAIMKKLISLWSSASEESVRVVAFLCILRLVNLQREALLDYVLKTMYIAYVKNAKFVSVNTLPSINFMRRSLVEIYALDAAASYQHVFLYIRQLAINLRNAIVDNKKENLHIVYNWQFVNSCKLWGNFLGQASRKPQVNELIYPFVQVCLGALKLVPTAAYFPLRFHFVQILMELSRDSRVYIPILPYLTEVLTTFDFNKKHAKVSMKPLSFTTVLRMGKAQMTENGFKDAIIDSLYGCILEYLAVHSHSIAFPDMALFVKCQIKVFLKKCTVAKYQRQMQQLLEKIEANVSHIETERTKLTCALSETNKIEGFETQIKNRGTPLSIFFENWDKVRNIKRSKQATKNEEMGDYNLPVLNKKSKSTSEPKKHVDSNGKVVLFPSDSEDDDDGSSQDDRTKRGKRAGRSKKRTEFIKGKPVVDNDTGDVVEDIVDW